ncbi:cyclophilin-like fold protein [Horticoccus sp. 23ND18S-11]|uniref:cyclophilin-like fold protein n=1 Tax=Horticoccus sp. 23ND18S-11 TaxID=3391832 RepID=UPI0039C8D1EF
MKSFIFLLTLVAGGFPTFAAEIAGKAGAGKVAESGAPVAQPMKITIGKRVFTATLQDNAAAVAFKAMLPLSLTMHDVNRNEKAFDLPSDLPTADANPRTIRTGDLMLWNSRTVVLFYQSFATSYSDTRLGQMDDASGLAAVLGAGSVKVAFELK